MDRKSIKKVYLTVKLNKKELKIASYHKANCIICLEAEQGLMIPESIEVCFADSERIEGTWLCYDFNFKVIQSLISEKKIQFKIDQIDIASALTKLLFWTNFKFGILLSKYNKIDIPKEIVNKFNYFDTNRLRVISKYLYLKIVDIFKKKVNSNQIKINEKSEIGILVNNTFEYLQYFEIISNLKHHKISIFHYGLNNNVQILENPNIQYFDLSKITVTTQDKLKINPFKLTTVQLSAINRINEKWDFLSSEIERYKFIKSSEIKILLMNVAENLPERNLLKVVLGNEVKLYNTMNGLKSGEAQDSDVKFDKWFIWDQEMREMMINKCKLPNDLFILSGHFTEEKIRNWEYKKYFDSIVPPNSITISVFSVKGLKPEKVDAMNEIFKLCQTNKNIFVIIKPHPNEKSTDYIKIPINIRDQIKILDNSVLKDKSLLYDLLYKSDLSIVFGSTVALESKWMGTPCLTIEYRPDSIIYCVDETNIIHIKKVKELNDLLSSVKKKSEVKMNFGLSATAVITDTFEKDLIL